MTIIEAYQAMREGKAVRVPDDIREPNPGYWVWNEGYGVTRIYKGHDGVPLYNYRLLEWGLVERQNWEIVPENERWDREEDD